MNKLFIFTVLLLVVVSVFIVVQNNLNVKETSGRKAFLGVFTGWVVKTFKNMADVTAYAVKHDWTPDKMENKTVEE